MNSRTRSWLFAAAAVVVAGGAYFAWQRMNADSLPAGIATGNGRVEAVEIDVSTRTAGRLKDILVNEGDFVEKGQVLAQMDIEQLTSRRNQAEAELKQAVIGIDTARSMVTQREAERAAAAAVVAQHEAQLDAADRKLARSEELVKSDTTSLQVLDNDRANQQGAKAAVEAAKAQLAAAEAGINAARAQVINAEAAVEAARAAIASIVADVNDATLAAPRTGRIQYRVAEPGEVLGAGGRVLSLVDVGDVYMTFFLPTAQAGRVAIGSDVRIVLDAAPQYVIPARVSFVADVAQFTPKTVETEEERQKLMFRIKAKISPELLKKYVQRVKTGLPGAAYVKIDPAASWPANLAEIVQ
jgi:HlyD family secretion protein